jgi:hypothetical protein
LIVSQLISGRSDKIADQAMFFFQHVKYLQVRRFVFIFIVVSCLELCSTEFHGALIVSPMAVLPQLILCGLQASEEDNPNGMVLQVRPLSSLLLEHLPADPADLLNSMVLML